MGNDWKLNIEEYGEINFTKSLLARLAHFRQLSATDPEAGGILIGQYSEPAGRLNINQFTSPQKTDLQSRTNFFRSSEHSKLANKIWLDSNGHSTYVGLWHSHPETLPNYSGSDLSDWKNALSKSRFEGNHLLFVILGQTHIRVWSGNKKSPKLTIKLIGEYKFGN